MFVKSFDGKLFKIVLFVISLVLFNNVANQAVAGQAKSPSNEMEKSDKGVPPKTPGEKVLTIVQSGSRTSVNIRVPRPTGLELAESNSRQLTPRLIYVSNLANWRTLKTKSSYKALSSDLLFVDITITRFRDQDDIREFIKNIMWDGAFFFGNIPDTQMAYRNFKKVDNRNFSLLGVTKIDTEHMVVFIEFISPDLKDGDLEQYKKMMEDYFLKLRELNPAPLVRHELKRPRKYAIMGGPSITDDGEKIFIFRDRLPGSPIMKKVPIPSGFTMAPNGEEFTSFTFVSNLETWEKREKHKKYKIREPFNENLITISVSKNSFSDDPKAHDNIRMMFWEAFGEVGAFGDLPETFMAYQSYGPPKYHVNLMGNTKINDEYISVVIDVNQGGTDNLDNGDAYKKMMVDYFQKIRELNGVAWPENSQ